MKILVSVQSGQVYLTRQSSTKDLALDSSVTCFDHLKPGQFWVVVCWIKRGTGAQKIWILLRFS